MRAVQHTIIYLYLRMSACISLEYLELSGMVKVAFCMARLLSPNGSVKKHNLYSIHPIACKEQGENKERDSYNKYNTVSGAPWHTGWSTGLMIMESNS